MVIGLIGGVGSGKSTVLGYLKEKYDVEIIEADKVAKEVMLPGNVVYDEVVSQFPDCIAQNSEIDATKLSAIVFHNPEELNKLNDITHPGTVKEIRNRIKKSDKQIIVVESAILIGSGIEHDCDKLWYVYCEQEIRIRRLMENRGYTREKSLQIIKNQMTEEELKSVADELIDNSNSPDETKSQIDLILNSLVETKI